MNRFVTDAGSGTTLYKVDQQAPFVGFADFRGHTGAARATCSSSKGFLEKQNGCPSGHLCYFVDFQSMQLETGRLAEGQSSADKTSALAKG
jgi:hypothetical protein